MVNWYVLQSTWLISVLSDQRMFVTHRLCVVLVWAMQVKIRVQLKPGSKTSVAAFLQHHVHWKISEIRVVNTTDGTMSLFTGPSGAMSLSADEVNLWASSSENPGAASAVVTTVVEELWENQRRRKPFGEYSIEELFPSDPPAFSDTAGMARYKTSVTLPTDRAAGITWLWLDDWSVSHQLATCVSRLVCDTHAKRYEYLGYLCTTPRWKQRGRRTNRGGDMPPAGGQVGTITVRKRASCGEGSGSE